MPIVYAQIQFALLSVLREPIPSVQGLTINNN